MAYAQIQQKLEEAKLDIQRLRERMSLGSPTVHKDLSLISLIPKWSGSESTNSLEEFILPEKLVHVSADGNKKISRKISKSRPI
jgi:hypothetical protein